MLRPPPALLLSLSVGLAAPLQAAASAALAGCYLVQPQKFGVGAPEGPRQAVRITPVRPGEFELAFTENGRRQVIPVRSGTPAELAVLGVPSTRPITEGLVAEGPPASGDDTPQPPPQPVMLRIFADRARPVLLVVLPVTGYAEKVSCPPRG